MKKSFVRLIVFAVIIMIILNGILISLWWSSQNQRKRQDRPSVSKINEFIINEMEFDENSADKFQLFSEQHHHNQIGLQRRYNELKQRLNEAMFDQNKKEAEAIVNELGQVVIDKELELYRFFSEVMSISNEDQKRKFGRIFREATGAPEYGRIPMGNDPNRPPPPKR